MCNLAGCAGNITSKDDKVFQDLLIMGSLRGTDSTGAAFVPADEKKDTIIAKELGDPYCLLWSKGFEKGIRQRNKALIGHNRAATKGNVTRRNAHPFRFINKGQDTDRLVGAHNGTVFSAEYDLGIKDFDTDSETILFSLADKDDPKDTISKLGSGAWALSWFDFRNSTMNLIRNKERPLYWTLSGSEETLYWASEIDVLIAALNRNDIKRDKGSITLLPEDTLFSWYIDNDWSRKKLPDRTEVKIEGKKIQTYTSGQTGSWRNGQNVSEYYSSCYSGKDAYNPCLKPANHLYWSDYLDKWCFAEEWRKAEQKDLFQYKTSEEPHRSSANGGSLQDTNKSSIIGPSNSKSSNNSVSEKVIKLADRLGDNLRAEKQKKIQEELDRQCEKLKLDTNNLLKFSTPTARLYWSNKEKVWRIAKWNDNLQTVSVMGTKYVPLEIPLPSLNIESGGDHNFEYKKVKLYDPETKQKQKLRIIYWKGFKGEKLDQRQFEKIMTNGCMQCNREPLWGNYVKFVNPNHFLCGYCATDEDLFKMMLEVEKEKKVA